jgi:hypothetical protein
MNTKAKCGTTLTRHDWNGKFDSIRWAFKEHLKEQDKGEFNYAVLYGNEDCPEEIEFYVEENPNWNSPVSRLWKNEGHQ